MSILNKDWTQEDYNYDKKNFVLYGEKNGFKFVANEINRSTVFVYFSVKKNSDSIDLSYEQKQIKSIDSVFSVKLNNYKLIITPKSGMTMNKMRENLLDTINDVTEYLNRNNYIQCSELSGITDDVEEINAYLIGNQISFLTADEFAQKSQIVDMNEQNEYSKKENVFLGTIGALIGALIGVLAIVLIGQLGYIAYISGIIMGVCAIKGYQLLGHRLSIKGGIITIIVIILMTYLANQLNWAIPISSYYNVSIFEVLRQLPALVKEGAIDNAQYYKELFLVFAFTIVSAVIMIISAIRDDKNKYNLVKLI